MSAAFPAGAPPDGFVEVGRWDLEHLRDIRPMRAQMRTLVPGDVPVPDLVVHGVDGATMDSLVERLLLVASELSSNALRHGGGRATVALSASGRGWLVEVTDAAVGSAPTPAARRPPAEGGYGLHLVQALGRTTGWYAGRTHKHVWSLVGVG